MALQRPEHLTRFTNLESEHQRAMERATSEETKILELEEELRVVGSNLQQLEVSEEKALEREETYQRQIRELFKRSEPKTTPLTFHYGEAS